AAPLPAPYAPCVRVQKLSPVPQPGIVVLLHPVRESHASAVQGSPSSHESENPLQVPSAHSSFVVHASPSSQVVPAGLGVVPQPVCWLQNGSRHGLVVVQTSGVPGWQNWCDGSHVSLPSHLLLLSQSLSPFGQSQPGTGWSTGVF